MTVELAREVAALDGVVAVTLGGSLARGRADRRSDVDLGLYYGPARPFSVEELRALATELDDGHAFEVVGFGDWGPWINGGAWTRIRGTRVDLLYRDRGWSTGSWTTARPAAPPAPTSPGTRTGSTATATPARSTTACPSTTPPGPWPPAGHGPRPTRRPCGGRSCAGTCGRPTSPSRRPVGRPGAATWPMSAAVRSGPSPAWCRCCSP